MKILIKENTSNKKVPSGVRLVYFLQKRCFYGRYWVKSDAKKTKHFFLNYPYLFWASEHENHIDFKKIRSNNITNIPLYDFICHREATF